MKKTILAGMAVAALLLSSCAKDFTEDIESLKSEVNDLKSKVETIQNAVSGGAVVTAVEKTDKGIVVKMSDSKEYEITNGQDGTPGSVVKINDAGKWTVDGVETGYAARGENGDYYKPCTDNTSANFGKWIKVDGTTGAETVTDAAWNTPEGSAGSGLTAVWEDDTLMLYGVQGYEEDYYEICFTSELRGFAVYPTNWSAAWGLPCVTSYYMINPNIAIAVMTGNLNYPRLKDFNWQGGIEGLGYARSNYSGFGRWLFGIAYATYLGALGMTDDPDYNAGFDANSSAFSWQWTKDELNLADPGDILDGVKILCGYMAECFDSVETNTYIDFVPTTPIDLTYRVIPMGASLANYKFSILEHGLNITKVGGENRDNAVTISGKTKFNKKDELTLTANTSYFKAMGYTPLEFIRNYIHYDRYGDDGGELQAINDYVNAVAGKYLDAMGISQTLMINLEASTNGRGSEAIVSDGCVVKFEPFEAYIYFKNEEFNYIPLAFTGAPTDTESAEPVAKLADSYDLGSKVALRDPVIGNATKYGFDVQWAYSIPAEFGEAATVSAEGVITRSASAVSGTIVPVTVSAHVMTPANGRFMVANEGIFYVEIQ